MAKQPPSGKPAEVVFKAKNAAQRKMQTIWASSRIIFAIGPAGGGKSHCALALALMDRRPPLWLCRPAIPCGEELGFEPGTIDEKLVSWMAPFADVLSSMSFDKLDKLIDKINCEALSVGRLRGRTVNGTLIVDEAQNLSRAQLKCILTRLGEHGKIVICGDPGQSDLDYSALEEVAEEIKDLEGVARVDFPIDGCCRDPLVVKILERLEEHR